MFFESDAWQHLKENVVVFDKIFRQIKDPTYIQVLTEARDGKLSDTSLKLLNDRINTPLDLPDGVKPTKLFALKRDVARVNETEFAKLTGESKTFHLSSSGKYFYLVILKVHHICGPPC